MMHLDDLRKLPLEEVIAWARENPEEAQRLREQAYWHRVHLARTDPNEFCELVLRDEEQGTPIQQAPIHEQFQELRLKHKKLIVWGHVESGKTQQLTIGHTLWELGRNPRLRFVFGSGSMKYSTRLVSAVRRYIEQPGPIHDVFPELKPGPLWSATAFTVAIPGQKGVPKDPSVQAVSVGTTAITGSRTDRFIGDDILTLDNTSTPAKRQATKDWYYAVPMSRMTRHGRVCLVGNAFHPEDLYHELAGHPEYVWRKFPVLVDGRSAWKERWPLDRIEEARGTMLAHEFARQLLCIPRDESSSRFKREWIDIALRRGDGYRPAFALNAVPHGYACLTGVDLGVRQRRTSDLSVLTTILVHPNEDREILWIESGRWAAKEIVDRIVDTHRRYNSIVIVENNAAQQYIIDFTKELSAVPVRPFTTGRNKSNQEFGIESLATEVANGKWIIPSKNGRPANKEIDALVTAMLYYDPQQHTADHLMSMWFAREGARQPAKKRARTFRIDTMSR